MLDFEKMKAALEAEKNRLKMVIEAQEAVIHYMKKFDGKIINKKLVDYLNELDPIRAYFHGEKRAQEFNYVQQYYIKLAKDFSCFIRNKYDHDFKIGWIGGK